MRRELSTEDRILRFHNLEAVMRAGSGATRSPDVRGQEFDKNLKRGAFSESGTAAVASILMENIRRISSLATLPMGCFNYGRRFQEVHTQLSREHAEDVQNDRDDVWSEDNREIARDVERGVRNWMLGKEQHETTIGYVTMHSHVAGFATMDLYDTSVQIESLSGSLVIAAWGLFESLSEDLWEAALNAHPTILAALTGRPRSQFKEKETGPQQTPDVTNRITFNALQANAFDVRQRMGTILKESVSFRSLPKIREAYHRAFSRQHTSIDEILDDSGLQYAAAVRNVLVHKRGVIDEEFISKVEKVPDAVRLASGERLPLTGELCAKLCDSCRCCATWLVNAVHAWIVGHPEK